MGSIANALSSNLSAFLWSHRSRHRTASWRSDIAFSPLSTSLLAQLRCSRSAGALGGGCDAGGGGLAGASLPRKFSMKLAPPLGRFESAGSVGSAFTIKDRPTSLQAAGALQSASNAAETANVSSSLSMGRCAYTIRRLNIALIERLKEVWEATNARDTEIGCMQERASLIW